MQGTQNDSPNPLLGNMLDLDSLIAARKLEPAPVKLGGRVYKVRTDLTAEEVSTFTSLWYKGLEAQAFTILLGSHKDRLALMKAISAQENRKDGDLPVHLPPSRDATSLANALGELPAMHAALAGAGIFRATKALARFANSDADILAAYQVEEEDPEGESSAS